jgi:FMN phosphatase YigB (HAD superfamily)
LAESLVAIRQGIVFIDDSIENVSAAIDLSLQTEWASWGYHSIEDLGFATKKGIKMLHLSDLDAFKNIKHSPPLVG